MTYFVFADVHGHYSLLMKALEESGYDINNPDHMLISLGDNFDRGKENYKMYQFLKKMKELNKIILVKGNHEDLLLDMLYRRKPVYIDLTNGTYQTVDEFMQEFFGKEGIDMMYKDPYTTYQKLKEIGFIDFVYDMKDYYETNYYIYTHGFIPVKQNEELDNFYEYDPAWRCANPKEFAKSRWLNGIEMSRRYKIHELPKTIVVGHFHSSYGNVRQIYGDNLTSEEYRKLEFSNQEYFKPYVTEELIALDACTIYSKLINVMVVED